jgi:hypothetical protein
LRPPHSSSTAVELSGTANRRLCADHLAPTLTQHPPERFLATTSQRRWAGSSLNRCDDDYVFGKVHRSVSGEVRAVHAISMAMRLMTLRLRKRWSVLRQGYKRGRFAAYIPHQFPQLSSISKSDSETTLAICSNPHVLKRLSHHDQRCASTWIPPPNLDSIRVISYDTAVLQDLFRALNISDPHILQSGASDPDVKMPRFPTSYGKYLPPDPVFDSPESSEEEDRDSTKYEN